MSHHNQNSDKTVQKLELTGKLLCKCMITKLLKICIIKVIISETNEWKTSTLNVQNLNTAPLIEGNNGQGYLQ